MRRLTQGNSDALCGIYAIASFLQRQPEFRGYKDTSAETLALTTALESMERVGLLKPSYLLAGLEWNHLAAVCRDLVCHLYLEYDVVALKQLEQAAPDLSIIKILELLKSKKTYAIITHSRGNHWVLATDWDDDGITIVDSSPTIKSKRLSRKQCESVSTSDGVVLVPRLIRTY